MAELTAAADPDGSRVQLTLVWSGVDAATVHRVDPDGHRMTVRGADPAMVATAWTGYDHEAPMDAPVRYEATSTDAPGVTVESGPVTVDSRGRAWLKSPGLPLLNRPVHIRDLDDLKLPARRGVFPVPGRRRPVVIHDVRTADEGQVTVQTDAWADISAMRSLLLDGTPLLLQLPGAWGGDSDYISVADVTVQRIAARLGTHPMRRWVLPYVVVDRPAGLASGSPGSTWADAKAAYATWADLATGEASWLALAQHAGPE